MIADADQHHAAPLMTDEANIRTRHDLVAIRIEVQALTNECESIFGFRGFLQASRNYLLLGNNTATIFPFACRYEAYSIVRRC